MTEVVHPQEHSRAFENMVGDPDDVVGLLAYALFKQGVREEAKEGRAADGKSRNPTSNTVKVYREAAEQRLGQFASNAIMEATPSIRESAVIDQIEAAQTGLQSHITARTSGWTAFWIALAAWFTSLVITIVILAGFALGDLGTHIEQAIDRAFSHAVVTNGTENSG